LIKIAFSAKFAIIIITIVFLLFGCSYAYSSLVFYDDSVRIIASSNSTRDITAIVTEEGNCYIRGFLHEDSCYGVQDVTTYTKRYNNIFDPSAPDRFVQIYDQGDAKDIILSEEGGCIVTNQNKLLIFSNNCVQYTYPTYFCDNIISAKLVEDMVYILNTDHCFGYYEINSPGQFVQLRSNIQKFILPNGDTSLWLHTADGVLEMYESIDNLSEATHSIDDIFCFDVMCFYSAPSLQNAGYSFAFINNKGEIFYYRGYGFPIEEKKNEVKIIQDKGESVATYSNGAIVLDQCRASLYGEDIFGDKTYEGLVLADDVIDISSGMSSLNIASEDRFQAFGILPSSTTISIEELTVQ